MADANLNAAQLRDILRYDPITGSFYRLKNTGSTGRVGPVNVRPSTRGAYSICVRAHKHYAHRLAWLYMTGEWPTHEVDHIDGNPLNNRFGNLREATGAQNKQNQHGPRRDNKSGFLGVMRHGDRWRARIQLDRKSIHVGLFDSAEAAHAAYLDAKRRLHPFGVL